MRERTSGVYAIINKTKNIVYIGQAQNIESRKQQHLSALQNGTHYNKAMQNDFNNKDRFCFIIVKSTGAGQFNRINPMEEALYISFLQYEGYKLYNSKQNYYKGFMDRFAYLDKGAYLLSRALHKKKRIGDYLN